MIQPTDTQTVAAAWQTLCWLYALMGVVAGYGIRSALAWLVARIDYSIDESERQARARQ